MTRRTVFILASIFALALGIGLIAGCSPKPSSAIRVQLDWFPEPEHGGLYQALAKGYFAEEGLNVTLLPGGSNVLVTQFVGTGQAEIGQSATTQVIEAVAAGLPVINVASLFHRLPTGLIMHADNPVSSFSDLNGKTIMGRPEAVYIPYLKKKYGINFNVVPQSFGLAQFLQDPSLIQEGYFIAEPYFMEKAGAKVKWLALWDSGYDPAATLFVNTHFAQAHPDELRAFLRAYIRGWKDYLEGDPTPGNNLMKLQNPKMDDGYMTFSRDQIIKYNLGRGDPAKGEDYGTLSLDKIKNEIAIMENLGLIQPGQVPLDHAATLDYLPATRAGN
ncbi:MAG: ABC transporter substrate-binding protein [Opitutales bacterium]|jgi:NitT/TauT family transport system substrate-binding protein